MTRRTLALASSLFLFACPTSDGGGGDDAGSGNDGGVGAPIVTSVAPARGPLGGGTRVTVNGANFREGATVRFGDAAATAVTFESGARLSATTPAAATAGDVTVTVSNPDGQSASLQRAFRYEAQAQRVIRQAQLLNPATTIDASGAATVHVTVSGAVEVPGVTDGAGRGEGVRAQVGFAASVSSPPVDGDFAWADANYGSDDGARDVYAGEVALPGGEATWLLAARFSIDDGATWVLADRDGSANGVEAAQLARVTLTRASIGWCKLGGQTVEPPPVVRLKTGQAGPIIYGQVYLEGVTDGAGAGAAIEGQLGVGDVGQSPDAWAWADAAFNVDTGSGANDEYQAALPTMPAGSYRFAFRFRHDGGPWAYCDADGLAEGGFSEDQSGTLEVSVPGIERCVLQHPATLAAYEGQSTDLVYGRVFAESVTDAAGQGPGVDAQLGYGPVADVPSAASWNWSSATSFNIDVDDGGDEYEGRISGAPAGTWAYAWRFRLGSGAWTYCDLDGSDNGFDGAQAGVLTTQAVAVTQCLMRSGNAEQTLTPGHVSQPLSVEVTVPTLTGGSGPAAGLEVALGVGAVGSAPSGWTNWVAASHVGASGGADVWEASLAAPGALGAYEVAFRARVGGGAWVWCDRDGAANGYQSAQAGALTVEDQGIGACRLIAPSAATVMSGATLTTAVEVMVPGVTEAPWGAPGLVVQVGVGPRGVDARSSALWGWGEVVFLQDETSGAETWGASIHPAYTGDRAVAARASLNGGNKWTYCDLDGSDVGGFDPSQQFDLTVTPFDSAAGWCNLQYPATAVSGDDIFGQVYVPGVTPDGSAAISASVGFGPEGADPGVGWGWFPAGFNVTVGNNNEYRAMLPSAPSGVRYTLRFELPGGGQCFGDLDGSTNGFSGGSNLGEVTP